MIATSLFVTPPVEVPPRVTVSAQIDRIALAFDDVRFNYRNEQQLHDGIDELLRSRKIAFEREVCIGEGERVDFLVDQVIAMEVKIKGNASAIFRQLYRYAKCENIHGVVVVHNDQRFFIDPATLCDVAGRPLPLRVVNIQGGWF